MSVLTVAQLADRWQCSTDAVYNAIKKGKLKVFRIGCDIRIKEAEVERYENGGEPDE